MMPLVFMLVVCAAPQAAIDTVVVCPQEFHQALQPWLEHRRQQGHEITLISNVQSAADIRGEVRRFAARGALRYIVLVGDANADAPGRELWVPTHHAVAVVNRRFGSEPEIATDNWYADLDDDRLPDVAIGRLTADSPLELTRIVNKILAYEQCQDFGVWRRQVDFVAGLGGFGAVTDAVVEAAAKSLITAGVPAAFSTTMTYGSWQSPYCPDPRDFRRVTLDKLNQGSLFWVYIGHGQQRSVDRVQVPGGVFPILSCADAPGLACRHGAPIACFLSCYSGAFDQPRDCLAEDLLRSAGGPVAILSASRVTMPYAMAVMGTELLNEIFDHRPPTLGDAILAAKRRTMQPASGGQRAALDAMALALSPAPADLEAERAEHLDLFNLVGDPLLQLSYPQEIRLTVPREVAAGDEISISGTSSIEGKCMIELVVRRDRLTFQPPARSRFDTETLSGYRDVYARANEPRLAATSVKLAGRQFAARLAVPPESRGACHVRVFVEGPSGYATAAADVRIAQLPR